MAVPTLITDLSTTAASNAPSGSDSPATLDDIQRAHAAFIAQLRDNTGFTTAKAAAGANSDITSLTGLTTPLSVAQGGTGAASNAATAYALKGANADITSLTNLTGGLAVTGAATLGYNTGAGGSVTQATNKFTSVTLNKPSGKITMNNAALASGATAYFTLTNSLLSINDGLNLTLDGSFSIVSYSFRASVLGGSATIAVTNESGGSLSDALQINFEIIKGSAS